MSEAVAQNKKDNKNEKTADTIGKVDIVKPEQIGVTNETPKINTLNLKNYSYPQSVHFYVNMG